LSVSVEDPPPGSGIVEGPKLALAQVGTPAADSDRVSVTPKNDETLTVVVAFEEIPPRVGLGDIEIANDPIRKSRTAVRVRTPSVAVTVMGYCPEMAFFPTVRVRLDDWKELKLSLTWTLTFIVACPARTPLTYTLTCQ